ncbi:hypothetical protein FisN_1Lh535 [Fistulifera solaris]|uniref:DUF2997 domain-containing protein n=1 Tax=Fistulifera solaris TaxID=1519565 RepID=A0A1Z5K1U8_FISSO|nr:hypothetical protein FisN_1Lh535 [Fistulifera solaris]|eukprot:GAX19991.1 hypothetical protein FisN_1Lh535 [Fistulifera solaris]
MLSLLFILVACIGKASTFTVLPKTSATTSLFMNADAWSSSSAASGGRAGQVEQIEFKIYPDGRVEETVRGVKGGDCHKITEDINAALGVVISSSPTEEMFEQEVVVNQKITQSDWEGSSSW